MTNQDERTLLAGLRALKEQSARRRSLLLAAASLGWTASAVVKPVFLAACLVFLPPIYGWPDAIAAAVAWVFPIALLASFVGPGFRLALKDRKAEPRLIQGQLVGASSVSTSLGLGMLMVQTRGGVEQLLVPPARLKQVPGNQVNVVVTVTPNLHHVKSVGVMGQRMVGRVEPPVPPVMRRLQLLPVLTPLSLAVGAVVADDAVALSPINPSALHALLAVLAGVVIAAAVYGISFLVQRRMMGLRLWLLDRSRRGCLDWGGCRRPHGGFPG